MRNFLTGAVRLCHWLIILEHGSFVYEPVNSSTSMLFLNCCHFLHTFLMRKTPILPVGYVPSLCQPSLY